MADVFLSYARDDRRMAVDLAERLEAAGYSVWWDRYIDGGADFGREIERELRAAASVVVLWSHASQTSKWVRDEAAYGRDEDKLLPLCIDETLPPLGFRQVQSLDFSAWNGAADSEPFEALIRSLRRMLDRRATSGESGTAPALEPARATRSHSKTLWPRGRRTAFIVAGVSCAAILAVVAYVGSPIATGMRGGVPGQFEIRPFAANPPDADRSARAATYSDAFRTRFTELGIRNVPAGEGEGRQDSEFVLTGEVVRDGDKEILTARIDDRATGSTLWSIRQAPSEGAVAEAYLAGYAIRCALQRRDRGRGPELLSRYFYGCASFLDGDFRAFHSAAKAAYQAAPDDPRALSFYAVSTAGVAYADATSKADRDRYLKQARDLAERALRLDPKNSDAAFAMGFTFADSQFAEQEKWWKTAVEADPESGWALGRYGNFLDAVGRTREAMDMELRAVQARLNLQVNRAARLFAMAGDWSQVAALYDRIRPLDPDTVAVRELRIYVMFGDIDTASRMLAERREAAGKNLGCWDLLLRARRQEPYDKMRFAEQCGGRFESVDLFAIAGDVDGAYREVERLLSSAEPSEVPHLFGPHLDAFRRDPRFWPLVARLGLTRYWLETDHWPDLCAESGQAVDCRKAAQDAQTAISTVHGASAS